jgi:putative methionine-R-sulfoxide reductase with GAF domain
LTFSHLDPVLDTLRWLKRETDIWFEITNLMIPGENDDPDETRRLCHWVIENLGDSVPLHFTAFHPDFKLMDKPRTPATTLTQARRIALSAGIKYCYVGNVFDDEGQTTFCPACHRALIRRSWHDILDYNLEGNHCSCGEEISGRFAAGGFPAHKINLNPSFCRRSLPLSLAKNGNLCFIGGSNSSESAPMANNRRKIREAHPHLTILENISTLISHSHDLQETLNSIVAIVAERMGTEVCSLYILDQRKERLTLHATMGLDPESIGKVSMAIGEGLTGLVIERMKPVMVIDALAHPRYKYFPETHEEHFHSFLGAPLIENKTPLGVLVVQTSRRREFSRDEIRLLTTISAQAASVIVQARLADSLRIKEEERKEFQKRMNAAMRKLRSYEGKRREKATKGHLKWRGQLPDWRRPLASVAAKPSSWKPGWILAASRRKRLQARSGKSSVFAVPLSAASSKSTM